MSSRISDPLILVTNDDGYDAPGIHALAAAVEPLGEVIVAAPDREQSAASHALTLNRPLRVFKAAERRYRIDGTPTDCVHLGIHSFTGGRVPDLVVSGINRGLNIGDDVIYSGTVAGAMEGALLHAPSIAFSAAVDDEGNADYGNAARLAAALVPVVLRQGLAPGVLLNVNVPARTPKGVRVTRQGSRSYRATAVERIDPAGKPYYWIAGVDMTPGGEDDGDHRAIEDGYASVSALHVNLTHEGSLLELTKWQLEAL